MISSKSTKNTYVIIWIHAHPCHSQGCSYDAGQPAAELSPKRSQTVEKYSAVEGCLVFYMPFETVLGRAQMRAGKCCKARPRRKIEARDCKQD